MKYDQFLAVMLTALGVMLAAVTLFVGLIAVFGYQFIRDEAKKRAEVAATRVAHDAVNTSMRESRDRGQATGLSESQAEDLSADSGRPKPPKIGTGSKKATSDKGLNRNGG